MVFLCLLKVPSVLWSGLTDGVVGVSVNLPSDLIVAGRQNGPPCHLALLCLHQMEDKISTSHRHTDTVRQCSPLLFFCLSPGFVLEAWPIRLQQIPHNSDNGGKKWLSRLLASNRCRGSLRSRQLTERNNEMLTQNWTGEEIFRIIIIH